MINSNFTYIIRFVVLMAFQVLLFSNIQGIPYTHFFVYIIFILILPFETPAYVLMLVALITGIIVDAFGNTLGIHASATILVAYLRPAVLRLYAPRDGYEANTLPGIRSYGLFWFLKYCITLVIAHQLLLHILDAFGFYMFHITLLRVAFSVLGSVAVIILIEYLSMKRK